MYDLSEDRVVRLADVDKCDGIGRLLRVLSVAARGRAGGDVGRPQRQATLRALEMLKILTRKFSLDVVDRVLAQEGPRIIGDLLRLSGDTADAASDRRRGDEREDEREVQEKYGQETAEDAEIFSRALLLLCRWAALSPLRLRSSFLDFWRMLTRAKGNPPMNQDIERQVAYAFCGVCVLSIDDIDTLMQLCVTSTENMRALCAGLEVYLRHFPHDRLARMVVGSMMMRNDESLVRRALEVGECGLSFLKLSGSTAGAAILRGHAGEIWDFDGVLGKELDRRDLAEYVVTSVGTAEVFGVHANASVRNKIVCALLQEAISHESGPPPSPTGSSPACSETLDESPGPGLNKELSMDSIVLDALCTKTEAPVAADCRGIERKTGMKRGVQMIVDAYKEFEYRRTQSCSGMGCNGGVSSPGSLHRLSKRIRRTPSQTQHQAEPLTIRIGTSTAIKFADRNSIFERVGVLSLFGQDDDKTIHLPSSLPTIIPDEDRFAHACSKVLRFMAKSGEDGNRNPFDERDERDERDDATTTANNARHDCWIVADYLNVDCERLHDALYRASTPETIVWILNRFPHMLPTVARCAWRTWTTTGGHPPALMARLNETAPETSGMIVEGIYAHLCESLL